MSGRGIWLGGVAHHGDQRPVQDVRDSEGKRQRSVSEPDPVAGRVKEELGMTSWAGPRVSHREVGAVRDLPAGIDQAPGKVGFLEAVVERAAKATDGVECGPSHETCTAGKCSC